MRKALTAVLVLGLALAGCGRGGSLTRAAAPPVVAIPATPAPAVTSARPASPRPTPHRPAPTTPPAQDQPVNAGTGSAGLDRFIGAVQAQLPDVAQDRRDEEIADLGATACDDLGRDAPAEEVIADTGTGPAVARRLIRLAITDVCPARRDRAAEFG